VYRSETGVESDEPLVVEQVISKKVRVNDATYGLKTAAKIAHEKVAREEFLAQKAAAIGKQRSREAARKQERIDTLDADIARVRTALLAGTSSDPAKAKALLATLEDKRNALVAYTGRV
jgi:hypothetical protein